MKKKTTSVPAPDLLGLAKEVVDKGGDFRFNSRGYSMRPTIDDGEQVTIGHTNFCDIEVGNVVLAATTDGPRLHRVIERGYDTKGGFLIILGDADVGSGHRVRRMDIVGRVVDVRRSRRRMAREFAKSVIRVALGEVRNSTRLDSTGTDVVLDIQVENSQ